MKMFSKNTPTLKKANRQLFQLCMLDVGFWRKITISTNKIRNLLNVFVDLIDLYFI